MGDIEDTGTLAHRLVLVEGALIPERHLPAGEFAEARAQALVLGTQAELTQPGRVLTHQLDQRITGPTGINRQTAPGMASGAAARWVQKRKTGC